jgi:hypothetical protein
VKGLEFVGNYAEGYCTERVATGYCKQDAILDKDKCYYHNKLSLGLLDNSENVFIYDEESDM